MLRLATLFLAFGLVGCSLDLSAIPAPDASRWRPDTSRRDAGAPRDTGDGRDGSTPPDAPGADGSTCTWTYTPAYFDPCDGTSPTPSDSLTLDMPDTWTYDTDDGTLTAPDGSVTTPTGTDLGDARAIWVVDFDVRADATLRVEGSRPLLVAASGDITIVGTIDASSHYGDGAYQPGAGADPSSCPSTPPEPGSTCSGHGASGGGGGAFGGAGGRGGLGGDTHNCGDGVHTSGFPGGRGGAALVGAPSALRGGCAGREGAPSTEGSGEGPGGPGGGAVHLTARGSLIVSGAVHAGGAGGRGASEGNRGGGGGGGSGGMIGLEAADLRITATAFVAANGGGGGGGVDHGVAEPGEDGRADGAVAGGGLHEAAGTDGGDGGWRGAPGGASAEPANRGGGGGGGGVGFILLRSPGTPRVDASATLSPAQMP